MMWTATSPCSRLWRRCKRSKYSGGLYIRVMRRMRLLPFTLKEIEDYLKEMKSISGATASAKLAPAAPPGIMQISGRGKPLPYVYRSNVTVGTVRFCQLLFNYNQKLTKTYRPHCHVLETIKAIRPYLLQIGRCRHIFPASRRMS